MSSQQTTNSGCFTKVLNNARRFLFNLRHPIYPSEPSAPPFSEFVIINSEERIRCMHFKPDSNVQNRKAEQKSKRNSLSEEYWFTKWNRPLKIGNCSCSFRRSLRLSAAPNIPVFHPNKITNVETFVERMLQDTIQEAFQEYYMGARKGGPTINLAFENTEVELVSHFKRCKHDSKKQKKGLVIFFHGIGSSCEVWERVMYTLLARGFEVVAPDLLGHGFSSAPDRKKSYSFSNLMVHALAVFDRYVKENAKCVLIGHSYGCSLATGLYRHRPQQISQLILISGGGPTPLAPPAKDTTDLADNTCFRLLFEPLLFCGVNRSLLYSSRGKSFDVCEENSSIPGHILEHLKLGQCWPEGDAAFHRRILVPTLLVHGLQDKQVTLVQQCEMERTLPRSFLELIPNAGHSSMVETPEHLTHMILCFLDWW